VSNPSMGFSVHYRLVKPNIVLLTSNLLFDYFLMMSYELQNPLL